MPRVKRAVHARKKRRKVLEQAKGYWGLKKSSYRYAKEQVEHSLVYAYRDRKARKRSFRRLWIMRINAAARQNGLSYNQFVAGCRKANIELDRKVLADLAVSDPAAFGVIAKQAKAALDADAKAASPAKTPSRSAKAEAGDEPESQPEPEAEAEVEAEAPAAAS
jgi:large subunit ribosomal protein L20